MPTMRSALLNIIQRFILPSIVTTNKATSSKAVNDTKPIAYLTTCAIVARPAGIPKWPSRHVRYDIPLTPPLGRTWFTKLDSRAIDVS